MPITLIATYTNAEAMKPAEVELNLSSYYVYIIAGKSSSGSRLYVDGNSTTLDITPGGGDDTSGLAILARVTSTVRNQFNYMVVNGDTESSAGVGSIRGTPILTFTGPGTVKLYGVL